MKVSDSSYSEYRLGSDTLLFHHETKRIVVLNESAALIWQGLINDLKDEMVFEIAAVSEKTSQEIEKEIAHLENELDEWQLNRLAPPQLQLLKTDESRAYNRADNFETLTINLLSTKIEIVSEKKNFLQSLQKYLSPLISDSTSAPVSEQIAISCESEQFFNIWYNGHHLAVSDFRGLVANILTYLQIIAATNYSHWLALHAASFHMNGKTFLLMGESGAGKSTLLASLIAEGVTPLSDDLALISEDLPERNKKELTAIPLPIAIKKGSWSIIESKFGNFCKEDIHQIIENRPFRYLLTAPHTGNHRVTHLIFPRYSSVGKKSMSQISVAEAMLKIGQAGYNLCAGLNEESIQKMLNWVQSKELYSLEYTSSEESLELFKLLSD